MTIIKCSGCNATFTGDDNFESSDFDQHSCPSLLPIEDGESFDDWKRRCEAAKN